MLSTYAALKEKLYSPWMTMQMTKQSVAGVIQPAYSLWLIGEELGVAPTTAVVPTRTLQGAMKRPPFFNSASRAFIGHGRIATHYQNMFWLCDRLSHQGGLSGTVITAQTTNLPTAALTRYTDGVGVWAMVEIYTIIGSTATTFTASYTNTVPTAGRTSVVYQIGGVGFREVNRAIVIPLQVGDKGVRSVENIDLLATTGTAGAFGVTLFKPLMPLPCVQQGTFDQFVHMALTMGIMPEVLDDACLFWMSAGLLSGTSPLPLEISIFEDAD